MALLQMKFWTISITSV